MDITPEQRQRLDSLLDARRLDLGLTWREVALRAGLSIEAVRLLRAGPGGIRELTARKFDRAFEWMPGSLQRFIEEGATPEDVLSPAERETLERYARGVVAPEPERRRNGKSA